MNLNRLRELKECLNPATRSLTKECELMRLHYVDIRKVTSAYGHGGVSPEGGFLEIWDLFLDIYTQDECVWVSVFTMKNISPERQQHLIQFLQTWDEDGLGQAVMKYSLWVGKHWDKIENASEVRKVLLDHLDPPEYKNRELPTPQLIILEFLKILPAWQKTAEKSFKLEYSRLNVAERRRLLAHASLCAKPYSNLKATMTEAVANAVNKAGGRKPSSYESGKSVVKAVDWESRDKYDVHSRLLDVYAVKRMLQSFNVTKDSHQPKKAYQSIFFGGSFHACQISLILKKLGFRTLWKGTEEVGEELRRWKSDPDYIKCYDKIEKKRFREIRRCLLLDGKASTPWFSKHLGIRRPYSDLHLRPLPHLVRPWSNEACPLYKTYVKEVATPPSYITSAAEWRSWKRRCTTDCCK